MYSPTTSVFCFAAASKRFIGDLACALILFLYPFLAFLHTHLWCSHALSTSSLQDLLRCPGTYLCSFNSFSIFSNNARRFEVFLSGISIDMITKEQNVHITMSNNKLHVHRYLYNSRSSPIVFPKRFLSFDRFIFFLHLRSSQVYFNGVKTEVGSIPSQLPCDYVLHAFVDVQHDDEHVALFCELSTSFVDVQHDDAFLPLIRLLFVVPYIGFQTNKRERRCIIITNKYIYPETVCSPIYLFIH